MRPSIPMLLAVCSLPVTGLVVAEAAAPKVRATSRAFAVQPNVPRARRTAEHKIDPKLASIAVSLLRRYADDAADPTDLDLKLQKRLKSRRSARTIAKRVLGRIDGLAPAKREQTFGKGGDTKARLSARAVAQLGPKVALDFGSIWQQPSVVLPAEGVPPPTQIALALAGVASNGASDADGTDEVIVAADWFDDQGAHGSASMPASGTTALAANGAVASGATIFDGVDRPALLVSAVFEDDDGSAATAREDYQLMLELALSLADGLAGNDPITRLELAINTCSGLLEISDPQRFGDGAVVWTRFGGSGSTLHDLYATPASQTDGVVWKSGHDHVLASGSYEVLFDVPAPPPPDLSKINVKVTTVKSLKSEEHEPPETTTKYDLTLWVGIRNTQGGWGFPDNKNSPTAGINFSRIVQPGPVAIELSLLDRPAEVDGCWFGGWGGTNCSYGTPLDLRPGANESVKITFDPATGHITGDATGNAGDTLTFEGNSNSLPNGRVSIVVTAG